MSNVNNKINEVSSFINSDIFENSSIEINSIEKKRPYDLINDDNSQNNNNFNAHNNLNKESNFEIVNNQSNNCLVEERLNDEKRIIFDMNFENMKNYKHYFKHNNCESIIKITKTVCSSRRRKSIMRLSIKKKRSLLSSPKLV